MIPKPGGVGLRNIAVSRTQYRTWAKCHREPVRACARGIGAEQLYINTVEGRQVGDRTYRLEVKRTLSGCTRPCAGVLWDLEKAFG